MQLKLHCAVTSRYLAVSSFVPCYPFLLCHHAGAMNGSQSWPRFLANTLLWAVVLFAKVLFDFFVVLQPLGTGDT